MQTVLKRRALAPARPSHRLRAQALLLGGDKAGAAAALMEASQDAPQDPDLHAMVASLLCDLGHADAAIGAGYMAIAVGPGNARAHAELGRALFLAGKAEAALQPCARAVVLAPRNLGAMVTFGAVLFTLGRHEQALQAAQEAVGLDSRHYQARGNLSLALDALGLLDEAEAQSRIALELEPGNPQARHNLAGLRLGRGKLDAESWGLYEARLELTPQARALAAIPRWGGEDVAGKTVLLHAEQGFGDVIQFARYAPMVAARGARVLVAVERPMSRLVEGMPGVDGVALAGVALPAHDIFCPIASLPGVFGTRLETIPARGPYVSARADLAAWFRPAPCRALQVGLVWAGNPGFVHDGVRSMDAGLLGVLADVPGVVFHSLQKSIAPPFPMKDRMGEVMDFADTAGLVAGLDLVISVDTAVAHLAGAMGKPVWMLSRFMGCWRWMQDRADSPWYPSMRIFRQKRPGDWGAVVADVRAALVERARVHECRPEGW